MHRITRRITSFILTVLLFFAFLPALHADVIYSSTWDFSVDLPEGFTMVDAADDNRFLFEHQALPVQVLLRAYPGTQFDSPRAALSDVFSKLHATGDIDDCDWRNAETVIGSFTMTLGSVDYWGWAVAARLSEVPGIVCSLSYISTDYADVGGVEQFLLSCADSLNIDTGSYREAGPITSYAFPKTQKISHKISIHGIPITIQLDADDIEADRFVIEREFAVLSMYSESPLWKEAWQRYYRQIFRNSCNRLKNAAFQIQNALSRTMKADKPMNAAEADRWIAEQLLSWTQEFTYQRDYTTSDFTPVTAALTGSGCDCDSRSMLITCLLMNMGIPSSIFVSREYSHAVVGVQVDGKGARLDTEDGSYILGETTAKVDLGLMAKNMSDSTKWLYVPLVP